ncbi:MAG: NAD(P)H-hydrate dehydratase [Pirellulaceae bacterium]|nr:NAD(P)H-hydrate dehydratase [Pirellulaceae bacterium]
MSSVERIEQLPPAPARPVDGHKGTFGRVMIVAGSAGMSGAACLAGYGALCGGAGLVTLAIPQSLVNIVASVEPSWLTLPLADTDGHLSKRSIGLLEQSLRNQSVVAIGPGLGDSDGVRSTVQHLYATSSLPMVVDADGLNAFASQSDELTRPAETAPRVLTPHPGEFARLLSRGNTDTRQVQEELAIAFAAKHQVILLLKGAQTITTDGHRLAINRTGNSGMATGGSGDVLTGLISALLAQGMSPFEATQLGAHLHGLAGDIAAELHSPQAMIASNIHQCLGLAWQQFLQAS